MSYQPRPARTSDEAGLVAVKELAGVVADWLKKNRPKASK